MDTFEPANPYDNCEYAALLEMDAYNRHGVPGLGNSDENWNSGRGPKISFFILLQKHLRF
jgi:hypothetical protein